MVKDWFSTLGEKEDKKLLTFWNNKLEGKEKNYKKIMDKKEGFRKGLQDKMNKTNN